MFILAKEIYNHSAAFLTLVSVNIKTSVATTRLGWLWWIIDPLVLMAIYYFIIHEVFQRGGDDYHLFVLCGIVSWQFFARSINASVSAIRQNRALIRQIGMPISTLIAIPSLVQMFFATVGILIVMVWNYPVVGYYSLTIVPLLFLIGLLSYGLGLVLAVCEAFFKDTSKLVAYGIRAGFFFSPVLYHESRVLDSQTIPEAAKFLFELNPMTWIIPSFRRVLLDGEILDWRVYFLLLVCSVALIQLGLVWLRFSSNRIVKML